MNYDLAVFRSKEKSNSDTCVHGLDKNLCGFCTGIALKKERKRKESNIDAETLERYDRIKATFKNFREIWNEDEFFAVYANLRETRGTKQELTSLYRTSFELSRTLGAVRWAMEHIFSTKDYHRGKIVIEFRQLFGLDKGI